MILFPLLGQPEDFNFGMMVIRMLLFLGLTIVLIYLFLRKILPLMINVSAFQKRSIKILERVPVDQKRSLLVVEVQEKFYLMGSAEGQINILMELDGSKLPYKPVEADKSVTFESVLKRTFSRAKS